MRKKKNTGANAMSGGVDSAVNAQDKSRQLYHQYSLALESSRTSLDEELRAYSICAKNLKISGKRLSRVKGAFTGKMTNRKRKKHAVDIENYNTALDSYIRACSQVNWLMNVVNSTYENMAALKEQSSPRISRRLRLEAEGVRQDVLKKKKKAEKMTDGLVIPLSAYIN